MKNVLFLMLALFFVTGIYAQDNIIGKWKPYEAFINGEEDFFFAFLNDDSCPDSFIEFTRDNQVVANFYDVTIDEDGVECELDQQTFEYFAKGNQLTMSMDGDSFTGTYRIENGKLYFSFEFEEEGVMYEREEIYSLLK